MLSFLHVSVFFFVIFFEQAVSL